MSLLFRMWMMNYLIINLVLVIRRTKTQHVKETTGVINNKACNNEEDVTFRTGTVHLSFLFSLTDYVAYVVQNTSWYNICL